VASLVSVSAASHSTAREVSITVDGKAVPFHRCFINSSSLRNLSPTNKHVRLNCKVHSSSTTKQIDVGLFNEGGFHLADEEMPDKADLLAVLRVLDVSLRRLSDDERLPLALGKLIEQCVVECLSFPSISPPLCSGLLRQEAKFALSHGLGHDGLGGVPSCCAAGLRVDDEKAGGHQLFLRHHINLPQTPRRSGSCFEKQTAVAQRTRKGS